MNAIAADMCTNARRVVRKSWIPKLKLLMAESDAYSAFLPDGVKTEEDALGADPTFDPASLESASGAGMESGGSSGESLPGVGGDGGPLFWMFGDAHTSIPQLRLPSHSLAHADLSHLDCLYYTVRVNSCCPDVTRTWKLKVFLLWLYNGGNQGKEGRKRVFSCVLTALCLPLSF